MRYARTKCQHPSATLNESQTTCIPGSITDTPHESGSGNLYHSCMTNICENKPGNMSATGLASEDFATPESDTRRAKFSVDCADAVSDKLIRVLAGLPLTFVGSPLNSFIQALFGAKIVRKAHK